jgi:predicted Fe-Mo cluster-binding NifX family protein
MRNQKELKEETKEEINKMKIAVSATAGNLDAMIDLRFGRCPYFLIVDSETMRFEVLPNAALGAVGGAGIQAAQAVASKGVNVLITGNVGPNAFQALSAAGIKVVTGAFGTVREVVEKYKHGELKGTGAPTVRGHFGMGGGRGQGLRRW